MLVIPRGVVTAAPKHQPILFTNKRSANAEKNSKFCSQTRHATVSQSKCRGFNKAKISMALFNFKANYIKSTSSCENGAKIRPTCIITLTFAQNAHTKRKIVSELS